MPDPRERDPNFPDRPTHRDFVRLSEIVQAYDDRAEIRGESPFAIAGVDEESLIYFMKNRLGVASQRMHRDLTQPRFMALYLDAFALGKRFNEERVEDAIEHFFEGESGETGLAGSLARRVRKAMRDGTYPPTKPN